MPEIIYNMMFESGRRWQHIIPLSIEPLAPDAVLPAWTQLDFHRCTHCPLLDAEAHPHCPLAAVLAVPVAALAGIPSWTPVTVEVTMPARTVVASTTLQRAAGSMMGLLSALSGCPHTRAMLPMAMFHLPFSTSEETFFRIMGTYLIAQHLRKREGDSADGDMHGLLEIYSRLRAVNNGMANRIRAAAEHESSVNAIVLLDILAADMSASIEDQENDWQAMFAAYLS